jgi:predicted transcriptional regulator of viral defense system
MGKNTFSIAEAKTHGLSPMKLHRMCKRGTLIRIERGIYQFPATSDSELQVADFRAAHIKFGAHAYISGISALAYYNLTEVIPKKISVIVPPEIKTTIKRYHLVRSTGDKTIGIIEENGYRIASVPRLLFDVFKFHYIWSKNVAAEALRKAMLEDKEILDKATAIAHQLGEPNVFEKWMPFISPEAHGIHEF